MMCTLLVYPYCVGVYSSRKIAAACERNLAFMAIVAAEAPDFRTISDFRKIHLDTFHDLFVEVLRLAGQAGMVKLGNVALDGSKFKANASRHKAMSYGYMEKELARLRAEIRELTERQGFDPNIAVGRQKHHQSLPETVECHLRGFDGAGSHGSQTADCCGARVLCQTKAHRGIRVRSNQTGPRLPPVSPARSAQSPQRLESGLPEP